MRSREYGVLELQALSFRSSNSYEQRQKILFATEFTEDTEETRIMRIMAFLGDLCVRGGKKMLAIVCSP